MAYTPSQSTNKNNQYYKQGNDVFRVSDNAAVKMGASDAALDWNKLGLNFAHLNTLQDINSNKSAPTYSAPAPTYSAPAPTYSAPAPTYSAPAPAYSAPAPTPKQYVKGTDSIDIFDRAGNYITSDQAAGISSFWDKVEYLPGVSGFKKPAPVVAPVIAPIVTQKPVVTAPVATTPIYTPPTPVVTAPIVKKYIKGTDSIDIFDKATGAYISADEATKIPDFWSQVEYKEGSTGFTKPIATAITAGGLDMGNGIIAPTTSVKKDSIVSGITSDLPYIKGTDSLDIYNKATGAYISADESSKIPDFWTKVEYSNQALDKNIYKKVSDADLKKLGEKFEISTADLKLAEDSNVKAVKEVFGEGWTPSDVFVERGLIDRGIVGAVRIDGSNEVYTLGTGGMLETPESYQSKFGTLSQEGIVGIVDLATALSLGIVPATEKSLDEILKPINIVEELKKGITEDTTIEEIQITDSPEIKAAKMAAIVEQEKIIAGVDAAMLAKDTAVASVTALLKDLPDRLKAIIDEKERDLLLNEKSAAIASALTALNSVKTQYDKYLLEVQDRKAPISAIYTQQARVRSQAAIELSGLAALVDVANGQYDLGKERLDDYIKTWKDSQDWLIKSAEVEIANLGDKLTDAQQASKDAAEMKLQTYKDEYAQIVADQTAVKNLMLTPEGAAAGVKFTDTLENAITKTMPYILDTQKFQDNLALLSATPKTTGSADASKTVKVGDTLYQWNPNTQRYDIPVGGDGQSSETLARITILADSVAKIDSLIGNTSAIKGAVGNNFIERDWFSRYYSSGVTDYIAGVEQIISQETLSTLIALKAAGGTLGAISEKELAILQASASKIGSWALHNDKENPNKVTGYKTSEAPFLAELESIRASKQRVIDAAGGLTSQTTTGYKAADIDEAIKAGYEHSEILTRLMTDPNLAPLIEEARKTGASDYNILLKLKESLGFNSEGSVSQNAEVLGKVALKVDGEKGGQCGSFVNRITGLGVGDSYNSKLSKMDKSITAPEPGMVFTMPYKEYGHIGFIIAINDDGTATVKDSNYGFDEKIKTHKIALSKMSGFARV